MGKLPYIKFFTGDWNKDPAVQACSLAARGLWLEMLILMFHSERRGYLLVGGHAPSIKTLAQLVRASASECARLLKELQENEVFSTDDQGVIHCRRMLRDEEEYQQKVAEGKSGGNPFLLKNRSKVNEVVKQGVKDAVKEVDKSTPRPENPPSYSGSDSVASSSASSPSNTDSRIKTFIDWWCEEYQKRFDQKYLVTGKDAVTIKKLLGTLDEDTLKQYATKFLDTDDAFVKKNGYTIGVFWSQINKLASGGNRSDNRIRHDEAERRAHFKALTKTVEI